MNRKRKKKILWCLVVGKRSRGHAPYISSYYETRKEAREAIKNNPQRIPCAWHIVPFYGVI